MARSPVLMRASELDDENKGALYNLIDAWYKANNALGIAKAAENAARLALVAHVESKTNQMVEGTNTVELEFGKALKIQKKINRTIDPGHLQALKVEANAPDADPLLLAAFERVIVYKPEVAVGDYKALNDDYKIKFANAVIEKPGTPGIELTTPKR